ncbi:MAG: ATP-dependent helicase HrpB [Steroidobacteraceae bacterium]
MSTPLPITEALPRLLAALERERNVVLEAPPGAGKSTGVPLALLGASWLGKGQILMLEPRRLAARAVAARMAMLLGEPVGKTVGYRTRLDTKVSAATRIEVVTEGILTRRLQHDQSLDGVALVIFDEYHERSLNADLGLALCLDVQGTLREDLRLLVMSATLDGEAVARLLGDAPRITSAGKSFAVDVQYQTVAPQANRSGPAPWVDIASQMARTIGRVLDASAGDVLAFLPGQGEIRRTERFLLESALPPGTRVLPLYGDLPIAEQDAALEPAPSGQRKIVLATNIAETSLTIEGIRIVVDSGLERRARFDPGTGMSRLETVRIARSAADQRRGRAGRLNTGVCYRLWTETEQAALAAQTPAEMLEADLAPLALELALWGAAPTQLRWLDPPPAGSYAQSVELLQSLGALTPDGRITPHGREMSALGTHPRLAHMLLKARVAGAARLGTELAAVLTERDPLRSRDATRDADLRLRIDALRGKGNMPGGLAVDQGARHRILQTAGQLARQLGETADRERIDTDTLTGELLAHAYPDRIGLARSEGQGDSARYLLSGGRGAMLKDAQLLGRAEMLVVAELDAGDREARIRLAAPITRRQVESVFRDAILETERIEWDSRSSSVLARKERWLGALKLDDRLLSASDPERIRSAMLTGIRELGLDALPWSKDARVLQTRIEFARAHDTQAPKPWPQVDDAHLSSTLEEWLAPWLDGISRRDHLSRLSLASILESRLDWPQQQRLGQVAPTHLDVPSGSRIPIEYTAEGPVLSVRLQEVFGMTETPMLGGGKVPVTMQLLSPARRPVQVTRDLESFWTRGYADVKRELKGRYPRHYWPDNPLEAEPTARAKPRGT